MKFFTRDRRKTSLVTEYNSILELTCQTWIIMIKNFVSSHYSVIHPGDKYLWFAYLSAEFTICYLHNYALWGQWLEFLELCVRERWEYLFSLSYSLVKVFIFHMISLFTFLEKQGLLNLSVNTVELISSSNGLHPLRNKFRLRIDSNGRI